MQRSENELDAGALARLAGWLVTTFPACDDPPRALMLLHALALGEPVDAAALDGRLEAALHRWPNAALDERGRVVAFGGLSLTPTPHRFMVAGRRLHCWCAWDALFLPALLNQTAEVTSTCPVTARQVRLTVEPAGLGSVDPEPLWVSFPARPSSREDVIGTFCCHVHFLAGRAAARRWTAEHAGMTAVTLPQALELGRIATRCYGVDQAPVQGDFTIGQ